MKHLRYISVRLAIRLSFGVVRAVTRLLPAGHPSRVFLTGFLDTAGPSILNACRPYIFAERAPHSRSVMRLATVPAGSLLALDLFAAAPVNLGIMPQVGFFTRLGAPDLAAEYGQHFFTMPFPF